MTSTSKNLFYKNTVHMQKSHIQGHLTVIANTGTTHTLFNQVPIDGPD